MTSPVPRITNPALQSSVDDVLMQVDRDTVLKARDVLLTEAAELDKQLSVVMKKPASTPLPGRMGEPGHGVWIGRCSDDPVSGPAQLSFNTKIEAMLQPCSAYIADLRLAGEQLAEAARQYGHTDDAIYKDFKRTDTGKLDGPVS
ncbi:hypothetical protein EV383_5159 [Pseudonocardia sediminis]|uniref:Excreted virulence factor EspC (Type VII ESX diderm) n=1 Tax=Pseudonocardia sediminis TaxID=1397368 RepID=A0A4Q7V421_PSEST|nr:hypothetical protein [Pseudonocardia sediminis]RZT88221.1 hypothetical protein EV383_5159 [Pseudonocardia sediminis]